MKRTIFLLAVMTISGLFAAACAGAAENDPGRINYSGVSPELTAAAQTQPAAEQAGTAEVYTVTPEPPRISIWPCDCLPQDLSAGLDAAPPITLTDDLSRTDYQLIPLKTEELKSAMLISEWVYLLVAPFPTIQDAVSLDQLKSVWLKDNVQPQAVAESLLVSQSTYAVFSSLWGEPDLEVVEIMDAADILASAWSKQATWAIIPFEEIDPRWKVMRVEGVSPLDSAFARQDYALTIPFGLLGSQPEAPRLSDVSIAALHAPETNLDPAQMASVLMTGTTALVRYTAYKMEENGVLYPARDIADVLKDADITHISNEVSFWEDCPPADPVRLEARFCSDPAYFELLDYIDADVIELTGNHILDWSTAPFLETLELYREKGIPYFGGGETLTEAAQPATLSAKGQNFTFIGCSPAGPEVVWAEPGKPGSNPCRTGWMKDEIETALKAGAVPVVTFQHLEVEDYTPHSSQRVDFLAAANNGAVIVSGSQSHFPQAMTFVGASFVHYGLGNLFFDQMYGQNPREFIDRHFFYNGRYISTQLLTLLLEDSSKPRLMTESERAKFLQTIFDHCNWETAFPADIP